MGFEPASQRDDSMGRGIDGLSGWIDSSIGGTAACSPGLSVEVRLREHSVSLVAVISWKMLMWGEGSRWGSDGGWFYVSRGLLELVKCFDAGCE